jgi:hypothetical protein
MKDTLICVKLVEVNIEVQMTLNPIILSILLLYLLIIKILHKLQKTLININLLFVLSNIVLMDLT